MKPRLPIVSCLALLLFGSLPLSAQDASPGLVAYVGTYTSPLKNMLSTQVDLPPGNGRGIHLFRVDRETGEMSPEEATEMVVEELEIELGDDVIILD